MPRIDRDAVLAATDLPALATEICGEPRGRGAGARWHCPNPVHPDNNPSMGVYRAARGHQRWKCHACGEGGTAIDLLMISSGMGVRDALTELARRTGLDPVTSADPGRMPRRPGAHGPLVPHSASPATTSEPPPEPDPAIAEFVAAAARLLWEPIGAGARRYLHGRGFTDLLLAVNRIGFDPGPRHLPRPDGLPHRGPGIVFPVLDPDTGRADYYQLRYLNPAMEHRYDQPVRERAPNPRIAFLATVETPRSDVAVICEGFPDGLTVAHTGLAVGAVLGTAHAGAGSAEILTQRIITRFPQATTFIITTPPPEPTRSQPDRTPPTWRIGSLSKTDWS
ncbi:CHC2 zinc finger domain-containing protein [Protofrankia symbiont of Coriaria ruscifolia]|uniref:CHC2 zinc finger domain-containing protein n=1 Tax=Protofrankia symbiont of Coriaria ruscifolia TaxID=1306542 RepID=UPI001F5ED401|nr:CHC2 zinc finger domain-containing protein [Protofrankia symbiont of Coriaria ruscifolia]